MEPQLSTPVTLTPAQQRAADGLLNGVAVGGVTALKAKPGMGRTTVLNWVHGQAGGSKMGIAELLGVLSSRHPLALEESFLRCVEERLATADLLIIDDLHLLTKIVGTSDYPRSNLLEALLTAVLDSANARGKRLLFGLGDGWMPWSIYRRAHAWSIETFGAADYECMAKTYLGDERSSKLDFAQIHRFASMLSAHQLKSACLWVRRSADLTTDAIVEYLRSHDLMSNVQMEEVAPVSLRDLKGVDDVIEALEAKIVLPFENDSLTTEYRLKAKRGVLLAGPPGTGKTTIGRALARRLKGKFFLIDGTVVAGTSDFYEEFRKVFDEATRNAPSVIFIDDTDLMFEGDSGKGIYRYLLTLMDGLETASAEGVCVMMTAMDVGSLPPAMLRSGRVELWLETRLPDAKAREAIIADRLAGLPAALSEVDIAALAAASYRLTGADLKAVIEDGKLLFAHDQANGKPARPVEDYFIEAMETVRANRRNYTRRKPAAMFETVKIGFEVTD